MIKPIANSVQTAGESSIVQNYNWVINLVTSTNGIPPWGNAMWRERDLKLMDFWPTVPYLAGAIRKAALKHASLSFEIRGGKYTRNVAMRMFQNANFGQGWINFAQGLFINLKTQDNGAFVELIRKGNSEQTPVIGFANLESAACQRTGDVDYPILYTDPKSGKQHKLAWYQVAILTETSPYINNLNGLQISALSSFLNNAMLLKDFVILEQEQLGGRHLPGLDIISGLSQKNIEQIILDANENADNEGRMRSMKRAIISTIDPTADPKIASLDFKRMPDDWDFDTRIRWLLIDLANCLGIDLQDVSPLFGNNLGTSTQSDNLARSGALSSLKTWQKLLTHLFNNEHYKILPRGCEFAFDEVDNAAKLEDAEIKAKQSEYIINLTNAQIITTTVAQQMLQDEGILRDEYLEMLNQVDNTPPTDIDDTNTPSLENDKPLDDEDITQPLQDKPTNEPQIVSDNENIISKLFKSYQQRQKVKQLEQMFKGLIDEYDDEIDSLVTDALNQDITQAKFEAKLETITAAAILAAYLLGSGKKESELTKLDKQFLQEQYNINAIAVAGYGADIYGGKYADEPTTALNRNELWTNTIESMLEAGKSRSKVNRMLKWVRNPAKDSCVDCLAYDGQVKPAREWEAMGVYPRGRMLKCGGYHCGCSFVEI